MTISQEDFPLNWTIAVRSILYRVYNNNNNKISLNDSPRAYVKF